MLRSTGLMALMAALVLFAGLVRAAEMVTVDLIFDGVGLVPGEPEGSSAGPKRSLSAAQCEFPTKPMGALF